MPTESGTLVSLAFAREGVKGTFPSALTTAKTDVTAAIGSSQQGRFTLTAQNWADFGFAVGQTVRSAGFTIGANNGDWVVLAISAGIMDVYDPNDDIVVEATDVAQIMSIIPAEFRATGRAFDPERALLESAEVRSDRQKADVRHGFETINGAPGFELSSISYDNALEGIMSGGWLDVGAVGSPDFGSTAGVGFIRSAGSFISDGFRVGDIITTGAYADSNDNGTFTVTAVVALTLTVAPNAAIVGESTNATPTLVYNGRRLDVGSTMYSYYFERRFTGVSQFQGFNGCVFNTMDLSIQPEAIVGGSFGIVGMSVASMVSSSPLTIAPTPAPTTEVFAAFDGALFEGGSEIAVVTGLDFTLNNNRAGAPVIGARTSPDIYEGTLIVTGTMTAYFENATLYNKFINESSSTLWLKLDDPSGAFMSFVIPNVKYTGASMDPPQEGPVPLVMPFQALVTTLGTVGDGTVSSTITIQRSNALVNP